MLLGRCGLGVLGFWGFGVYRFRNGTCFWVAVKRNLFQITVLREPGNMLHVHIYIYSIYIYMYTDSLYIHI